ncbi:MAG: Ig-like domain-containing protein [Chloroflexi bacterium]|nr:Ig-like domain-containing protein [Chloroflexota bacterium]
MGAKTDASGVATISFRAHPSLCTTFDCPTNLKLDAVAFPAAASTIVTAIDTRPTVKSTFPEHQDQTVHRHTTVQITFSEAMNQTSVFNATTQASSAFCLFLATSTCAAGRVAGAGSWSTNGMTFTFDPTVDLLAGQKYRVTIGTSAQDLAGNSLASAYSFSFQTTSGTDAVQPTVVKSWPQSNESDVSVASKILIEFSEPMDRQSTERAFCLSTATACGGTVVTGSFDWAEGDTKLNFAPATSLSANTTYHVRVCADADTCTTKAQDVAGNNLLQVLSTTTFSFATATTSQPRAEISFPREAQHIRGTSMAILGTAGNGDTNFNRYELKWGDAPDNCSNLVKNSNAVNQVFTESTYPTGIGNGTLGLWDTTQVVPIGQTDQKYLCLEVSNDSGPKVTTKVSVIIDNAGPVVSAIAPTATNKTTKRAGQTVTVNFAYTETYPASYLIRVCGDGSSETSCGSTKLGEKSFSGSLGGGTSIPITDTLTLTTTATAGNYDLLVTVTDEAGNTGSLREIGAVVVQGSASFVVTADKTDLSPGQITTIRATVRDSANNPLNSQTVTFTKDNSCTGSQLVPTTVVAGVNGEYTIVLTACSTAFARITVRATTTVGGTALSDSVTIYDPPPAPPEDLELSVGSIRLRWRPSPSPDVAGYTIYVGTQSGQYDRIFDAGLTTSYRIEDVTPGATYYVVMRSYDRSGQFGPTTTEASLTLPAAHPTVTATATVSATATASGTATVALSSGITTTATATTTGTIAAATPLASGTVFATATASGTVSATGTPVASPSGSATPSPIVTPAATPTGTVVPSRTPTPTSSPASGSAAGGVGADATATPAPSATATAPSRAWTATPTVVATLPPCVPPLPSLTATPSVAASPSVTPQVSATVTATVTATTTATVTGSTSPTPSGSPTVASSTTPSPTVTGSPTAAMSATATPVASVTVTAVPTTTVPMTATPTSTPAGIATGTPASVVSATASPTGTVAASPTATSTTAQTGPATVTATSTPSTATQCGDSGSTGSGGIVAPAISTPTATATVTRTPTPTGPRPAGPEAYEPNDTVDQARPIALGQTYGSYLETASDVDYFRVLVSVPEGETRRLHVRVYNLPVDADLALQGPTGADLGTARHRGSTAVELRVTAVVSGEYLIKLAAVNAGSDRPYSFIASAQ